VPSRPMGRVDEVLGSAVTVFAAEYFEPKYRFLQVEDGGSVFSS
jgi:hypothetical protein